MRLRIRGIAGGKIQALPTKGGRDPLSKFVAWLGGRTLIRFDNQGFDSSIDIPAIGSATIIPIPGPVDAMITVFIEDGLITAELQIKPDGTDVAVASYTFSENLEGDIPFRFGIGSVKVEGTITIEQ